MRRIARGALVGALRLAPSRRIDTPEREVLLIRPDHLGDVLFLTPGIRRLRHALPGWRLAAAVGPWAAPVLARNPDVDVVVPIPFPGFTRSQPCGRLQPYRDLLRWADKLRARRPAAALILRDDHWWGGLLALRAGIPQRFGFYHPASWPLLSQAIDTGPGHWVERNVSVVQLAAQALGGDVDPRPVAISDDPLVFHEQPGDAHRGEVLVREHRVDGPFVVIHPGSGAAVKLWPVERWAAVASAVAKDLGLRVVLTGSAEERPLVASIRERMSAPAVSLAGLTDLGALAALYRRAALVAGVDSGPLHLAVAVGTPTLHLFGPSDVRAYGPWGDPARHRVLDAGLSCARCGDLAPTRPEGAACMLALSTVEVTATMLEMLSRA